MDHIKDGEEPDGVTFDCTFYEVDKSEWGSGGRVYMFKPIDAGNPEETGRYSIYMKTNVARSAEVVRMASNQHGSPSGLPSNNGAEYTEIPIAPLLLSLPITILSALPHGWVI